MSRRNPAFFVTYDLGLLIYLAFEGASFYPTWREINLVLIDLEPEEKIGISRTGDLKGLK
ncbi:MAG: hypothetical protein HLUCCX10_16300 [Algoriphagus marincola HL-49]|uniref:Uncharacterized protein n=1 Tax=Algoriphagus marincola HL-49 TaxID=1305737 RepID=A0A0P8A2L0_9BACT|nr:MAG: hypothetical protein HLUCCX10_16300 [Algoriphagus marincola HL-49]